MKKVVFAAFVGFWSSIATIATLHAMGPAEAPPATARDGVSNATETTGYTLEQVAEHGTLDDCWMAIDGVVYDFTTYVPNHPTPAFVLEQWCGKEATEGMRTKGYGRDHSPTAWGMLEGYGVGPVRDQNEGD
ncbi:cytochrome b5-like heme/steroid binding domain-containing protein [Haliea sp. E1-2-M8]|uniref:cytochrome b5 domain-containing protein n=1 Tax=Haliea sp. E1-2-M8 TaxID=3064706 RepID=UPI002723E6C0|nr:cytochrome b5-like heme/steroid binding domain-containing protein [Haliea sp. E1-2-M8]MDO8863764.1 cytochrome b5-like heme/steroid binding domain-containing protein [Haliea sp. E1-2-M8]